MNTNEKTCLKRARNLCVVTLMIVAFAGLAPQAWAQATTSVRGTVTDPSGNAVVGASVVLANPESKAERTVTTDSQGDYQFLLIPPGTYTLTVKAEGFRGYEQKNLGFAGEYTGHRQCSTQGWSDY